MKWMNRFSASVMCAVVAPFVAMTAAQADDGAALNTGSLRGVDGCVQHQDAPTPVARFDVTRVEPVSERRAARDTEQDESVDVGSDNAELYADDLFSDAAVAAKGLGEEAGWNIQVAGTR